MSTPINISASRGASILALSKWKTPVQSWLEMMEARQPGFCAKHKYNLPEFEYGSAMRWGHAFESAIIELAEKRQGHTIHDRERLFTNEYSGKITNSDLEKLNPVITCHIDGWYGKEQFDPLHEGKTTSYFYWHDNFGEPGTDKVPVEYQIQCQHQMICTGAEKVILSVLVFPKRVEEWEEMGWKIIQHEKGYYLENPIFTDSTGLHKPVKWARILDQMGYFHQYEIKSHPELQKSMIQHYTEFWNENVLGEKEPIPQTYDDIKALCTEPIGTILADETIERLWAEYKNIKSEIGGTGPLAKRADQIKVIVLDYMHNAGAIEDDESREKWILRDQSGSKLASYGKNKNGVFGFR
jgi:predicted phage-related endonuclease